jgi:HlyD family secretion protein
MGSTGLGSTAASLNTGSGGGGGGGDFMLVLQKLAKPGAHVKKGDVVAEFDRQNMLLRLDDYRASVLQREASLRRLKSDLEVQRKAHDQDIAKAKAALDKARLDLKTLPVLSDMDAVRAKLAVEEAEMKYRSLLAEAQLVDASIRAQIRNNELDLEQARIELRRAEANTERMRVKAPIDGLTVMQQIPRGPELAQVQEGDQLWPGMMFMSIVDPRSMVVNAAVNQVDVEKLRIGAKARVRFDAYPDLVLPARVYSIGGIAKSSGMRGDFVKEIPVRLKLEATDPRVIPDLSVAADVVLEAEPQRGAIAPLGAIFRDPDSAAPFVFLRTPPGWVRRTVELGVTSNIEAAIRSGLRAGDVVALDRPPAAASGSGPRD